MEDRTPSASPDSQNPPILDAEGLPALDAVTRRMSTKALERGGIKSIRVLNASLFQQVLEKMVRERIECRLTALEAQRLEAGDALPLSDARVDDLVSEYRYRWEEFRSYYEEKLLHVEALLKALAESASAPAEA
jgi:hypothetical protein